MGLLDQSDINILASAFVQAMRNGRGVGQSFDDYSSFSIGSRTNGQGNASTLSKDELQQLINGYKADIEAQRNQFRNAGEYEAVKRQIKELEKRLGGLSDVVSQVSTAIEETVEDALNDIDQYIDNNIANKNNEEAKNTREKANKRNILYQSEQNVHYANLQEIEVEIKRRYINEIKAIYQKEEEVRKNGLASYEQASKNLKDYINIYKSDVTTKGITKDKDGNPIDVFSARKELGKIILGPLKEKWIRAFGGTIIDENGNKQKLQRNDSFATTFIGRGGAALFGAGDKALKGIATGKMDVSGMASNLSSKLMSTGNPYAMAAGAVVNILKTAFEMYSKVDKAASDYARKVGGGAVAQDKMRKSAANLAVEMGKFGERTYNAEKILESMAATSEVFGRNLEYLSTQDLKAIVDLKDFGVSNETISQFDTLGISVERISKEFAELYGSAGKKGLNATSVIKSLSSNMKMAQNFTFERGRKALFDMAEKSAQLKFNLRDAEAFANKVGTLEGAMKSAAQLSVLGGGFAMQGNPMTLLYNALNDMEGLQDQMLSMTKDLVYWDHNKGQFEMSAFDRQRLKAMSEATGIDYSELTSQAFNQGRIDRISQQIKPGTDKDVAEYIKNIAFIDEKGNAKIQFHDSNGKDDGEAKFLSEVLNDPELVNRLKGESEAKDVKDNATVGDIMNSTRSIQDKLDDLVNQVKNYLVKGVMRLVERFSSKNQIESMYNFEGDKKEQFRRVRDKLSDGTLSDKDFKDISEEDRNLYKRMGILDKDGHYRGRSTDERYGRSFLGLGGDLYGNAEIAQMFNGAYDSDSKNKIRKYAKGGYTGDGDPDEIAGLVHKGEYVIDADTTKSMFSDVKNGENPMGFKDFVQRIGNGVKTRVDDFIDGKQSVKVEFGTLHLELGGVTKDIDMNVFANSLLSNDSFIRLMIQKMATEHNYGYRKDDAQFTYNSQPY